MHCQSYSGEATLSLRFATRNSRYSRAGPVDFLPASLRNDGITLACAAHSGHLQLHPATTNPPPRGPHATPLQLLTLYGFR